MKTQKLYAIAISKIAFATVCINLCACEMGLTRSNPIITPHGPKKSEKNGLSAEAEANYQKLIQELQTELVTKDEENEQEIESINQYNIEKETKLNEIHKAIKTKLEEKIATLENEKKELEKTIDDLLNKITTNSEDSATLKSELASARAELKKKNEEYTALNNKAKLAEETARLQIAEAEANAKAEIAKALARKEEEVNTKLQAAKTKYDEEIKKLKIENEQLYEDVVNADADVLEKCEEIKKLKKQAEELERCKQEAINAKAAYDLLDINAADYNGKYQQLLEAHDATLQALNEARRKLNESANDLERNANFNEELRKETEALKNRINAANAEKQTCQQKLIETKALYEAEVATNAANKATYLAAENVWKAEKIKLTNDLNKAKREIEAEKNKGIWATVKDLSSKVVNEIL